MKKIMNAWKRPQSLQTEPSSKWGEGCGRCMESAPPGRACPGNRPPPRRTHFLPEEAGDVGNALTFHSLAWQVHWTPGEAGLQGMETIKRLILLT